MARLARDWIFPTAVLLVSSCSAPSNGDRGNQPLDGDQSAAGAANRSSNGSPQSTGAGGTSATKTGDVSIPIEVGSSDTPDETCAAHTANAERRPVFLAFAFDVSGSMGKLDEEWHDPTLKWEPVVTATEDFFAASDSVGIHASLTFFPAKESKCDAETYAAPDVPMTLLPSSDFADAITAITPQSSDDWRGGTPTLAVLRGVFGQLERLAADEPNAETALVLVTDGYPQGCDENDIELVQTEVAAHAAISTYVIGVENPPIDGAPDTVSNLDGIAKSGKTSAAFLIETGDPIATSRQFAGAIEQIRGASISCDYVIPKPPAGETIDRNQVNVTYRTSAGATPFVYDPECGTTNSWHYDNATSPSAVVLCPDDCGTVMADPEAVVVVEFGCEQRTPYLQ